MLVFLEKNLLSYLLSCDFSVWESLRDAFYVEKLKVWLLGDALTSSFEACGKILFNLLYQEKDHLDEWGRKEQEGGTVLLPM